MVTIKQNFHAGCEEALNKQINVELRASYTYQSMAYYFDRVDVALPGLHKLFKKSSSDERQHAEKIMDYVNKRGGSIVLAPIGKPSQDAWGSAADALRAALELEKSVNQSLLDLHALASKHGDPHLTDFLEEEFLDEQVEDIKKLGDMITRLNRAGPAGLGEYIFDKDLSS